MKNGSLICGLVILATIGCASIVSDTDYPVTFDTQPSGMDIVVTNEAGNEVYRGKSPATVTLPASAGFFKGETYRVSTALGGGTERMDTLQASIDPWYLLGNLVFGGLIGWVVVDPLTGAMWQLDERFVVYTGETAPAP